MEFLIIEIKERMSMKRKKIFKSVWQLFMLFVLAGSVISGVGFFVYHVILQDKEDTTLNTSIQISRDFTREELREDMPLLLQWDKRWGNIKYGEQSIADSGCGPTALSMIMISLEKEKALTPCEIARFSEKNGYLVEGRGTSWSLMTDGASQLGLQAQELPLNELKMKTELDAAHPIICIMGPGDFTTEGHFIVIYDYTQEGFCIKDSNSIERSREKWTFEQLEPQIRNLWAYTVK